MGLGYLTIKTRMADDAVPIADATVVVKDKQGNILHIFKKPMLQAEPKRLS